MATVSDVVREVLGDMACDGMLTETIADIAAEVQRRLDDEVDTPGLSATSVAYLARRVHVANARWWVDPVSRQPLNRNVGEMLMLTVSELAEGMEGHRKNLKDDHLPHRPMLEVELADALIRILDMAEGLGLDIGGAFAEKMEYNAKRADHTFEARAAAGGKKY